MATATRLTDVEGCVLGVIWQRGPCTAYAVRKEFAVSVTPRWSASAGSIYPVLERLSRRRLVRAVAKAWGPRSRTQFAITARGRAQLQRWVGPPFGPGLGGPAYDPLRTRSCFLGAMTRPERARFVRHALRATQVALTALRRHAPGSVRPGDFEAMSLRGARLALEARLRWLEELRGVLGGHRAITAPATATRQRAHGTRARAATP